MKTILFICTGNAGRSQIAAALCQQSGPWRVLSAGVEPWDHLHPVGSELLTERGFEVEDLYPKSVDTYADTMLDMVVTIGDRAGDETPRLLGQPVQLHWPIADPADADGTGNERETFERVWDLIAGRLPALMEILEALPDHEALSWQAGISTCLFRPGAFQPDDHLPLIADAGFSCLELCLFFGGRDFAWDTPGKLAALRQTAEACGVHLYSVHAASGLGCMRMGFSRQTALDMIKTHADIACELGATVVPMHAGPDPALPRDRALQELREDLDDLAEHARSLPCRFAWENEPKGISTQEHLSWLKELGPGSFSFILDPGHGHIAGTTESYLDHCDDLLCSLHINDNDGTRDLHRLPGQGTIDWAWFRDKLKRSGYYGPLMLEVQADDRQHELPKVLAEARETLALLKP